MKKLIAQKTKIKLIKAGVIIFSIIVIGVVILSIFKRNTAADKKEFSVPNEDIILDYMINNQDKLMEVVSKLNLKNGISEINEVVYVVENLTLKEIDMELDSSVDLTTKVTKWLGEGIHNGVMTIYREETDKVEITVISEDVVCISYTIKGDVILEEDIHNY